MPRKKTQEEYEQQVKNKAPHVIVKGKYSGNRTPIEHYCLIHKVLWCVSPFNFLQHPTGCEYCQKEVMNQHIESVKKTDEQFRQEVVALGTGIIPLERYQGSRVKIQFQCKELHVWYSTPHDILSGYGCPYCSGQQVLKGYNDLWTTNPDVAKMLKDPSAGYSLSRGSKQKTEWLCPDCGTVKISTPKQVVNFGLACPTCSDKISYPNKFIVSLLSQVDVETFSPEWSPEWIGQYSYDVYFISSGNEYIVEMDGGIGHGNIDFKTKGRDVEGLKRDIVKDNAAKQHGITLIRIDCNYTKTQERLEYVKQSILNSELNKILDLSCVDWNRCNQYATKSLHMKAARLYDNGLSIREISKKLYVSYDSVYQWLKRLAKEGLCSYVPVQGRSKKTR